jgi:hypothetical protein
MLKSKELNMYYLAISKGKFKNFKTILNSEWIIKKPNRKVSSGDFVISFYNKDINKKRNPKIDFEKKRHFDPEISGYYKFQVDKSFSKLQ